MWKELEINCGFGGGEETQRFGPRQETGSSLYQVDTVATISNKTEDGNDDELLPPWIVSEGCSDKVAVVVENHILLFEDCCSSEICTFKAEACIDALSWSEEGSFLVFVDRDGWLSLAHPETEQVLFSKHLTNAVTQNTGKRCFSNVILSKVSDETYDLIVITTRGIGFRFTCVDLAKLDEAVIKNDIHQTGKIQENIQLSVFKLDECNSYITSATILKENEIGSDSLLVTGDGDFPLNQWSLSPEDVALTSVCTHVLPDIGFKKCLVSPNGLYLIMLDSMNHISLWSRYSYCMLDCWCETDVDDFSLFLTNSVETDASHKSQAKEDLKIVLLSTEIDGKRDLIVLGLPNFEHVYTLKVSSCAALACLPIEQEVIMFLVGGKDDDGGNVHVKCLMEAIPENRFSRLIFSKKFDEAEKFAITFGIDSQMVYHVKSGHILDQLAAWGTQFSCTSNESLSDLMAQLKETLDKIEDIERIVNYCLRAQLPSLEATYELLNYAREKVRVYFETRKFTKSSDVFQELLSGINRLVTFETAFGSSNFNGAVWSCFLTSSLIQEVIKCFSKRNVNSAFVVWRRHQSEFASDFKLDDLNLILNSIPESTPSSYLIPWLKEDFIPFVLLEISEGQLILAEWLEKTARRLEFSAKEKVNWPDNALEMAEVMFTAFSSVTHPAQSRDVATPFQFATKVCKLSIPYIDKSEGDNSSPHASAMTNLGNLVKNLREVKSLHHEYNCKLSLDQFSKEDPTRIVFHLLDRIVAAELIPQTMKKYVRPYIQKNNLKADDILYEYICSVVDSRIHMASMWEPKVIAIINEIQQKGQKCEATLKLMLKAKTPWSAEVETLIASEMKANPDNEKLERQFQFAKLRKMMDGYGIRDTNLADTSKIQAVIRYMLSTDKPNSLEHALQITEHFLICKSFVYCEQIQYWIENDKIAAASNLLTQVSKEDLRTLIPYMINWVISSLVWQPLDDDDKSEYTKITSAVVLLTNVAMNLDDRLKWETKDTYNILKNMNSLQVEFGLFISYQDYVSTTKKELIQSFIDDPVKYTSQFSSGRKTSKSSFDSRLKRFTELLGYDDLSYYDNLIDVYHAEQDFVKIYEILCKLLKDEGIYYGNTQPTWLFHKVVCCLLFADLSNSNISWVKMANDMYQCACTALTFCPDDNISDYVMISKLLRFMCVIASQCESIDYQDELKTSHFLTNWIENFYKDDSLVLSSADVYPYLRQMILLLFPDRTDVLMKYESNCLTGKGPFVNRRNDEDESKCYLAILEFSKASQALVETLQSSHHKELSFQVLMAGVSVCSQRKGVLQLGIHVLQDDEANFLTEAELKLSKMVLGKGSSYFTEACHELVKCILSHRVIDHNLALCYLDIFSASEGRTIISDLQNKFKNKFSRIQSIAKVGLDFAALHDDQKFKESCHIYKECAYWGRKLQLLRVDSTWNIFKAYSDEVEKKRILEMLVEQKAVDLKSIMSFCQFFKYDEEEATIMYIHQCFFPSDQDVNIGDISYQERIDQCDLSQINNLKKLEGLFCIMVKKISSYDYERLTYIFKKIAEITDEEQSQNCAEENVRLLDMLLIYKRTAHDMSSVTSNTIMDNEEDEEIFDGKTTTVSHEIAKHRLPFHPLAKKGITWDILKPELTSEKNVMLLKPIVNKLNFETDQMYAQAVRMISTKELAKGNAETFNFSVVENILNMIKDHMVMMATAKWLVINLPRGEEKAKVLRAIIERASIVVETSTEDLVESARTMYQKFHDMYKKASYEAALMDFGITDKNYYRLCNGPAKLIIQLYEDYGDKVIFETRRFTGAPDIHALATRIAEINEGIDLERIHIYLMNKWLPWIRTSSKNDDDDMDMSIVSQNKEDILKDNQKNLRKVIYLLASSFNKHTTKLLLNAVFVQECNGNNTMTHMCRMRALQVLFSLVDPHTIEVEADLKIADIFEKLVTCMYLSELEAMHVSHSEETFKVTNKENLVKGLWRNHSHEPQGIRLISDICIDYQIFDAQLWNSLLLKLISFHMIPYLTHILPSLSGVPQLREIPSLTKVWKAVIVAPFISVSIPLSGEEEKACLRSAHLITRCPVILDIDLLEIASLMRKVGLYMQALFCLRLSPDKKLRKEAIHGLLEDIDIEVILSKVKKDRDQGIMDPHLDAVEKEVFDYIDEHGLYLKLFGTVYFEHLIGYLIRSGSINNLLVKTVAAGKIDYAKMLLSKFLIVHQEHEVAQTVVAEGLDATDTLLLYFQTEGLQPQVKPYVSILRGNKIENSISLQNDDSLCYSAN